MVPSGNLNAACCRLDPPGDAQRGAGGIVGVDGYPTRRVDQELAWGGRREYRGATVPDKRIDVHGSG
jgi:hypothetical protein